MILPNRVFSVLLLAFFLLPCSLLMAQEPEAQPVVPAREKQAEALYIDAVKARMLKDEKQEEELLKQVIKETSGEAAPYYDLARISLRQSKVDQAEAYIRKAIERNKENPWYRRFLAEVLVYQNKADEAADILRDLARTEKHNTEYYFQSAKLYESAKKYKEALSMLDEMVAKIGPEEEVLLQKQQLYLRLNDLEGAIKVARQLIADHPREGRHYANLADLYENNGQADKAREIYEKAALDFPEDPSIQYSLAVFYRKKGDTAKYDEYIQKSILNQEFDDETQITILVSYLQEVAADSVRRQKAVELTSRLAAQNPNNPAITGLYGQVLLSTGSGDKAADVFKKAVAADPSKFNNWQQLLLSYTTPKDADSLIKYSDKALRYFPNQAMVYYLKGIGHFNKKDYPAAVRSMNRAIELQPEDSKELLADMYSSLGDIYNASKEYTLSDSAYEQSLRLNPDNASVLNNYSYYLSLRGKRLDEAERMSKKSLELRPGEATFLDTYGWILYKQGKYAEARKYIEDALKANPNADGTLWEHLGDIHFRMNDVDKAVEHWIRAKEKGTDNPLIDKKIQDKKLYE